MTWKSRALAAEENNRQLVQAMKDGGHAEMTIVLQRDPLDKQQVIVSASTTMDGKESQTLPPNHLRLGDSIKIRWSIHGDLRIRDWEH